MDSLCVDLVTMSAIEGLVLLLFQKKKRLTTSEAMQSIVRIQPVCTKSHILLVLMNPDINGHAAYTIIMDTILSANSLDLVEKEMLVHVNVFDHGTVKMFIMQHIQPLHGLSDFEPLTGYLHRGLDCSNGCDKWGNIMLLLTDMLKEIESLEVVKVLNE